MLNKAQSRLEQANAKEKLLKNAEKEAEELMNKAKAVFLTFFTIILIGLIFILIAHGGS